MPKKTALITGITGQDGSYLSELLLNKGYEVHGMVRRVALEAPEHRLQRLKPVLDRITLHAGSLESHATIFSLIDKLKPTECYHLAAQSFVSYSFEDLFPRSTPTSTEHTIFYPRSKIAPEDAFLLCRDERDVRQCQRKPAAGNDTLPSSLALRHLQSDGIRRGRNFRESYGIFASSGILFNHESPRRGYEFVTRKITSTVARIKAGRETKLALGNLEPRRDWGFAGDYVRAMVLMLQQDEPDDYVIATGETHSVREFAELAFAAGRARLAQSRRHRREVLSPGRGVRTAGRFVEGPAKAGMGTQGGVRRARGDDGRCRRSSHRRRLTRRLIRRSGGRHTMTVALFHPAFETVGGAEILVATQAELLRRANVDVCIATFAVDRDRWRDRLADVPVRLAPPAPWFDRISGPLARLRRAVPRSEACLAGVETVLACNYPTNILLGACSIPARRVWCCTEPSREYHLTATNPRLHERVTSNPGGISEAEREYRGMLARFERTSRRRSRADLIAFDLENTRKLDAIYAISEFSRDSVRRVYGRKDVGVIYPVVRFPPPRPHRSGLDRRGLRVLTPLRLEWTKNVDTIIRGFARLAAQKPASQLHVVARERSARLSKNWRGSWGSRRPSVFTATFRSRSSPPSTTRVTCSHC